MNITEAAASFRVKESDVQAFDAQDPFNNNRIQGHLCRHPDYRYGALLIDAVNGVTTEPQLILCTPKIRYPFGSAPDGEHQYHWPKDIERVVAYEKYDGTNVCAYGYHDVYGEHFQTFKTRLTPVLQSGSFGDFVSLWREVLEACPSIRHTENVMLGEWSASYEMYGYRNPHMLPYDVPLSVRHLFSISQADGDVAEPSHPLLSATIIATCTDPSSLTEFYDALRSDAQAKNEAAGCEVVEGYVLYITDAADETTMWKCKPESIEELHWASEYIDEKAILTTTWNSLESHDEATVATTAELLREEFTDAQVLKSMNRVEKAVAEVRERITWRATVNTAYEATGLNWETDGRGAVMRALSAQFDGGRMRDVFTALKAMGVAT